MSFPLGIPSNSRMEAMQAAILLMPDPNREALQTLLLFLNEVAANSERNQVNTRNEKEKQVDTKPENNRTLHHHAVVNCISFGCQIKGFQSSVKSNQLITLIILVLLFR